MGLWNRILAALRPAAPADSLRPSPHPPSSRAPTLAEMGALLRAGMTRDEFLDVLEQIVVTRGLRMTLPSNDDRMIGLPVAEGDQLLCFLPHGTLDYVEYRGDIFLGKPET